MKFVFVIFIACIFSTNVFAQQSAVDRIATALGQCIGGFEVKQDEIKNIQDRLIKAEAKIKELEEKDKK